MKLYATVSGTRIVDGKTIEVSKGQGSNVELKIAVLDGDQKPLMTFRAVPTTDGYEYEQLFYSTRIKEKGEKQKTL